MSFEIVGVGLLEDNRLSFGRGNPKISAKIRAESLRDADFIYLDSDIIPKGYYEDKVEMVDSCYPSNRSLDIVRTFEELDPIRSPEYPDDFQVYLVADNGSAELVWARVEEVVSAENGQAPYFIGTLLNDPFNPIFEKIKAGMKIPFYLKDLGDGQLNFLCYAAASNVHQGN